MKHSFIDQYSDRGSLIHRLDPRTKLVATLLFILSVVLTPPGRWQTFALYLLLMSILMLFSRVPILYVLKRSLVVVPFVAMIAVFIPFFKGGEVVGSYNIGLWRVSVTDTGLQVLANTVIKAWLSILSLTLLISTTKLVDLLKALEQLRMPRIMVMILSFMYRYLFIIADEVMRMRQARDSRSLGGSRWRQVRTIGNMIGTLFVRSYERGERVYAAMVARGFDGQARTLNRLSFGRNDAYFGVGFGLILISVGLFSLWH